VVSSGVRGFPPDAAPGKPGKTSRIGAVHGARSIMTATDRPSFWLALAPLFILLFLLGLAVFTFGDEATGGPVQVALMGAGMAAGAVGVLSGVSWKALEDSVAEHFRMVVTPVLLLLSIGGLIAVWIAAGVIPALIAFGAGLLHPAIFYPGAMVLCSVVALATGSAWTTTGTIGVAIIAIAEASGHSLPMTAGAIISGAYFGDKLSPLSDTTNLSASMVGADLFVHVRYLLWTTVSAYLVAFFLFLVFSLNSSAQLDTTQLAALVEEFRRNFNMDWLVFAPMGLLVVLAMLRVPPLVVLVVSILAGILIGLVAQTEANGADLGGRLLSYWSFVATGYVYDGDLPAARELLSRGGMSSMLTTIWLIVSAMFFSGMMERSGCLDQILRAVLRLMRRDRSVFLGAGATALMSNVVAADQYLSIVLSTRMYAGEVKARGFRSEMLSRTAEDFGTVTSPLVPWNTCGAFMAPTLGVATWAYAPFCFFNIASPLVACVLILAGIAIRRLPETAPEDAKEPATETASSSGIPEIKCP
tara:strand:- start:19460 stop:21049 length:1590 start_codon:yes stop_codon:yes gene_type:complete